jgi:hypothetical protein
VPGAREFITKWRPKRTEERGSNGRVNRWGAHSPLTRSQRSRLTPEESGEIDVIFCSEPTARRAITPALAH